MSFKDIGIIIKRIDGRPNDDDLDLRNKSKTTQAMYLFKSGKKPIDVAIELDISANKIEDIPQEYWQMQMLLEGVNNIMGIKVSKRKEELLIQPNQIQRAEYLEQDNVQSQVYQGANVAW